MEYADISLENISVLLIMNVFAERTCVVDYT